MKHQTVAVGRKTYGHILQDGTLLPRDGVQYWFVGVCDIREPIYRFNFLIRGRQFYQWCVLESHQAGIDSTHVCHPKAEITWNEDRILALPTNEDWYLVGASIGGHLKLRLYDCTYFLKKLWAGNFQRLYPPRKFPKRIYNIPQHFGKKRKAKTKAGSPPTS